MALEEPTHTSLVTEEVARRIVARALQLEEARGSIRIEHLRAAARELGVSEAAFDAARDEIVPQSSGSGLGAFPLIGPPRALAIGALAGGALAAAFAANPFLYLLSQFAVTALGMVSGALALQHRRNGTPLQFQVTNLALWAGYGVASGILIHAAGYPVGLFGSLVRAATYLGLTSLVGMIAINLGRSRLDDSAKPRPWAGKVRQSAAAILQRALDKLDPHVRLVTSRLRT
jgi:hypothetical protein